MVSGKTRPFLPLVHTHKHRLASTGTHTHTALCLYLAPSYPSGMGVLSLSDLSRLSGADGWQTDRVEGGDKSTRTQTMQRALALSQPLLSAAGCCW